MSKFLRKYAPELAALMVVTIWGTNFVFQKAAFAEFDVFAFNFLRFSGMIGLGWLVVFGRGKLKPQEAKKAKLVWSDVPRMVLVGVLGYTCYITLSAVGLNFSTAFSSALLIGTSPLFMAILLWLLRMEQIRVGQWLAMLLAWVGVFIFLVDKLIAGWGSAGIGDLINLAGAFFYAAYNVAGKPLLARYPAPVLTAYTLTIGGIPILLISLPAFLGQDWSRVTLFGWLALAWSIVAPVYLAWTIWSWVNSRLGVARTGSFMFLVPLIGGITAWLAIGESFGIQKIIGGLVILSSLALLRYFANKKPVQTIERDQQTESRELVLQGEKA